MKPRDHQIELEVPEVEVCIDCSTLWDPDAERCVRPDDDTVQHAVEVLVERHYDELVDLCADLHVSACEERISLDKYDRRELDDYYDGRRLG